MSKKVNNPLLDAKEIQEMVKINTESTLRNIMEQSIKENMKNMINESDDEDYEEEVEVNEPEEVEINIEDGDEEGKNDDNFSEFEVDDNTLDLTGASDEDLIKVFKKVQGDTAVEVTQSGDGKVEVSDNETGAEYIIDLDELDEANLGYTTTYQRPTGINIPQGRSGPGGVKPLGDKNSPNNDSGRNYGKKIGDGAPFNESDEVDLDEGDEMDESGVTRVKSHRYRATAFPQNAYTGTNANTQRYGDYVRVGGQLEKVGESKLQKQLNALIESNKKIKEENTILKECVKQFKEAAQGYYLTSREVAMTNYKLAKAVNLFTENATTLDEKKNILERLQNCKTEKEINSLHETIKSELKNKQPLIENVNKDACDKQDEQKQPVTKSIFMNEEVEKQLGFMKRVLSV